MNQITSRIVNGETELKMLSEEIIGLRIYNKIESDVPQSYRSDSQVSSLIDKVNRHSTADAPAKQSVENDDDSDDQ